MMRILADENVSYPLVCALRDMGHEVAWVRSDSPGMKDGEVLERAYRERRVLLTFDRHFGDLVFGVAARPAHGVILLRLGDLSRSEIVDAVSAAIKSRSDWEGRFSVIEASRVRTALLKRH
ncbi:DUF5615 family PIN-like protein [bacterium]|nr:DUF5615 family PIN-like protein [bacterium]